MSDIEPLATFERALSQQGVPDPIGGTEPRQVEREGLPRGYRMRADAHYVDQLGSASGGQTVRMIDIDQLATSQTFQPSELRPLVESIRTLGVLHPLLVARRESGYAVIAGHRRLVAARTLRLATVPCLVHAADEARATLLAQADNLQTIPPAAPDASATRAKAVRHVISQHLTTVHACAAMIETSPPQLARAATDMMRAHAWRAARLIEVLDAHEKRASRTARHCSLASIVDRVVDGFETEGRLSGVDIVARIEGPAAGVKGDDHDVSLIVSSGLLATLAIIDQPHVDRPSIVVNASMAPTGEVRLAIEQASAVAPAALAGRFFDESYGDRSGGWCAVACALAVKAVAERLGGVVAFGVDVRGRTSLTVQLPAAQTR